MSIFLFIFPSGYFLVRAAAEEEAGGGFEPPEEGGRGPRDHEEELRAAGQVPHGQDQRRGSRACL